MVLLVSDEVRRKSGGPRMVVTGFANGMVECRWYDGYGAFILMVVLRTGSVDDVCFFNRAARKRWIS